MIDTPSPAVLVAILAVLSLADIATTYVALKRGATEVNPLARRLFGALGVLPAAILLKLFGGAPMVALAVFYPAWWPVPLAYAVVLLGVVANNLFELPGSSGSG